ncbi:UNVERIFIED_ORG: pimeloyl-ACP methyl ester carboxylesterase [Burkholderia sp. CF145]
MLHATELEKETVTLVIEGVEMDLSVMRRAGVRAPILFLHGFGSTKEDYADITRYAAFDGHPVVAYDAPGCGATHCENTSRISIPFLVSTAKAVLAHYGVERFHLVGHSMGGLTALMLADEIPGRVLSFVDIEGNVAPEDCFLSRQVFDHPATDADTFFEQFIERTWRSPFFSCSLYATSLRHKVRADAVRHIFSSMVELSDNASLLDRFLALPFPRMFMYGEQNASLSYLPTLSARGVQLAEVSHSGHFPMYSNPVEMWRRVAQFIGSVPSS